MAEKKQLRILDNEETPERLAKDMLIYKSLPIDARENIWDLINALSNNEDVDKKSLINKYADDNGVSDYGNLEAALNALLFIMNNAYLRDLSTSTLSQDLITLGIDEPDIATLLSEYDNGRKKYRHTAMIQTLSEHGNLFLGSSWRVSHVQSSDKSRNLNFSIIDLTFNYLKDGGKSNYTISLTPENIMSLKQQLDEIISLFSTDVIKIKNNK